MADLAGERLDSVGPDFEEFFEVNDQVDGEDGKIDFYNPRRDSKMAPNSRGGQAMEDVEKERAFLEKKIKPELQEFIKNIEIEEYCKTSNS